MKANKQETASSIYMIYFVFLVVWLYISYFDAYVRDYVAYIGLILNFKRRLTHEHEEINLCWLDHLASVIMTLRSKPKLVISH